MSDIQKYEDELFPEEREPQGFQIDTLEKAEWAMDKIARAEERIQRYRDLAQKAKARLDARLEEITKSDLATVGRMGQMVRPFVELEIAKIGKARSMKMLGGVAGFRQAPPRIEVIDQEKAITALESRHPECVRIKKEVDKTAVKKQIETDGEIPEGIEWVPGDVKFYITARRFELAHEEEKK